MSTVRNMIEQLQRRRAEEQSGLWPLPVLRPGAEPAAINELQTMAGFSLPASYKELLSFTDGIQAIRGSLSLLGCQDWPGSPSVESALQIRSTFLEAELLEELQIAAQEEDLFPIGGGQEADDALFASRLVLIPGAQETIVWLGSSDAFCFASIQDVIEYMTDPSAVVKTGRLISFPID